ncbi:MAG: DegV family protein [Clostridia bacterium]|nr:DegV family protein [Clostridia bacterium]
MSKIRIVTDSTADLPIELIKKYNITVVPLRVNFGSESYLEGVELTTEDFYKKLIDGDKLPTTSQPSPGDFAKVYQQLSREGVEEIFSIHISKELSGTYQSAVLAKSMVEEKDLKITVIDSQLVCMGLGLVVLNAAQAAKENKSSEEIAMIISKVQKEMNTFFVVDTLDYLQKGGRIGKASSLLGTLLNIKPILTIKEGQVHAYDKIRGRGKALDKLIEIAEQKSGSQRIQCAIVHANSLETALKLREKVASRLNCTEIIISNIGAVVGTHVGPGTIAFLFHCV